MPADFINTANLVELALEWILIAWIIITTVRALKKISHVPTIEQTELMKGLWRLEVAFGLSLCGLAGLGTIAAIYYFYGIGSLILAVTFLVFLLTYFSTKELEKVPVIIEYNKKIEKWKSNKKSKKG